MQIEIETRYTPKGAYKIYSPGKYQDESLALVIVDAETGEQQLRATVCVDRPAKPGHVFIKDWSENEGILNALVSAGVVHKPVDSCSAGFCEAHECRLTDAFTSTLNAITEDR